MKVGGPLCAVLRQEFLDEASRRWLTVSRVSHETGIHPSTIGRLIQGRGIKYEQGKRLEIWVELSRKQPGYARPRSFPYNRETA